MNSVTVVLWIIAVEIALLVVALIIGLTIFVRKTRATLNDAQNLVKSLEERMDTLSKELDNTLKNTSESAVHLKKTLSNTEKATSFLNAVLPVFSLVLFWKGITLPLPSSVDVGENKNKRNSVLSTISNIGKWIAAAWQGYALYNKYFKTRGGKKNGRQ